MSGVLRHGEEVAGYRIVEVVGRSGSGTVYLAEETRLGRRVALKLLAPELARDERFRERFLRESRVAASLDHQNIVPTYAAGEADGVLYLAMRYVEGPDLRRLLGELGRLAPERAVIVVTQVAAALDAAHASELVHRDVKPANILLTGAGERAHAYLCDFGLAKHAATAASLTREHAFAGTIDYVAPEQISGGPIDGRTDLYSLGCVLFECLTGSPPFERTTELAALHGHLAMPPPRVSELRPELPESLDEVLGGALAKDPDDRYSTCGDFAAAASAALAGHEPALPAGVRVAERAVRTFMFADVRGYTRYTRERGDEAAGRLASDFAELVDVVVRDHGGAVQELRGDEALMVFDSARDALACALALQRRFEDGDFELGVGIGIDAGEAVPVQGGFRGGALNLASRLCAVAGPGEVLASQGVVHLAGRVEGVAFEDPRPLRLKGYADAVRAYEVVPAERVSGGLSRRLRRTRRAIAGRRRLVVAAGVVLAAAAAAVAALVVAGGSGEASIDPGVALLDAATGELVEHIPVAEPVEAIYANGSFWVLNLEPLSFVQIDAKTRRIVRQIAAPFDDVGYYAVDGYDLWVTDYAGPNLVRVDVRSGRVTGDVRLSDEPGDTSKTTGVVVVDDFVWVTRPDVGEVIKVDPATETVVRRIRNMFGAFPIAFGDGSLWTFKGAGAARIDPDTGTVFGPTDSVPSVTPYITFGGGFAWTAGESTGTVYKLDRDRRVAASYRTGDGARSISYHDGVLWVGNQDAGTVTGIDGVTGATRTYEIGHPIFSIAAGDGLVLVEVVPGATFDDRIDAIEGEVAKLLIDPYQLDNADPAVLSNFIGFHIERATCATLLRYADQPAPAGWRLQPELAAAMPRLSRDGRTYTFTVRSGYRFAPPSNAPVTAEAVRASIERALSPQLGSEAPAIRFLGDVAGARAFHAGRARNIAGLRANGNRLTITLNRRAPDFLRRVSMPYFCVVPPDTPRVPGLGALAPPSAGPYYMAAHENGEYLILRRNPNYRGPRRAFFDAIALREGIDPAQAVERVQEGGWDGSSAFAPAYAPGGELDRAWGPGGSRARTGGRRYYFAPLGTSDFLALNAGRPLFRDVRMRRALAHALDREASARLFAEVPSDQLLSPALPGFRERGLYALDADVMRAKRLRARPADRSARMLIRADCSQCFELATLVQTALAALGVDLEIDQSGDPRSGSLRPGADHDIYNGYTLIDYPDSAAFVRMVFGETVPASWSPAGVSARVAAVDRLTGDRRDSAAAALADELVRDAVVIPFGTVGRPEFLSPRLGCKVFPPLGYGVDLATLCRAE